MLPLTPQDLLFLLDEGEWSLVDHQLPWTDRQRSATLKKVEKDHHFHILPWHMTPCGCSVVSLSQKWREKIREILSKEHELKNEILMSITSGEQDRVSIYMIMKALQGKTHYRIKHIQQIVDEMVWDGQIEARDITWSMVYSAVKDKK